MTIQEALNELGVELIEAGQHHHARPGWINIDCPWCGKGSHRFHLGYNLHLKYFNCWKCGGKRITDVFTNLGLPYEKAKEISSAIVTLPGSFKRERSRLSLKEPPGIGPMQAQHRRYLESRDLDPDRIARVWEVGGIGITHRFKWRLYIPVVYRARRVSWTTRSLAATAQMRYKSANASEEVIGIKEVVYGLDFCHHSVVIVEGPVDAWKVGPGAGALFGTAYTTAQINKLITIPNRYVCFDSSDAAQREAKKLCEQLACFPGRTENILLDAKDPGEASEKELKLLRKAADITT
jgi:hypothetical protein